MPNPAADPAVTPQLVKDHGLTAEEFARIKKFPVVSRTSLSWESSQSRGASTASTKVRRKFEYRRAISCPKIAGVAERLWSAISYGGQSHSPRTRSRHKLLRKRSSTKLPAVLWRARALLA